MDRGDVRTLPQPVREGGRHPTPEPTTLVRYWIEFAPRDWFEVGEYQTTPSLPRTFGVTAASLADALALVQAVVFGGDTLPDRCAGRSSAWTSPCSPCTI